MTSQILTKPYCPACGYDHVARNVGADRYCDSCGYDLSTNGGFGPPNAPSVPNAGANVGNVTFTWTESPSTFPGGYDFRYSIAGAEYVVVTQATSPQVVSVAAATEVCGSLRGYEDGVPSDWSADSCNTAT